eukprot:4461730-Pyramimonas_sp.AAC.1
MPAVASARDHSGISVRAARKPPGCPRDFAAASMTPSPRAPRSPAPGPSTSRTPSARGPAGLARGREEAACVGVMHRAPSARQSLPPAVELPSRVSRGHHRGI